METAQLNNTSADDNEETCVGTDEEDFGVEMQEDKTVINDN